MTILKCPNPGCPYQFNAAAVPPGAVVACPQCRTQFTLGPNAPPAAPAHATSDARPKKPKVIETKARPTRNTSSSASVLFAVLAVGAVALLAGGGAFVAYLMGAFGTKAADRDPTALQYDDYAIAISKPGDDWTRDDSTRAALGVKLVAFKRTQPDGWMAVEAKKYEFAARPGELRVLAREVLRKQFDELDDEFAVEEATAFGQPGERYEFKGVYRPAAVGCKGDVFACVVRNYAYWVFTWAPTDDYAQHSAAFAQFRDGIKVSVPTGETAPAVPKKADKAFRTKSGLFTLTDREGVWKEQPDPKSQDLTDPPVAELWLRANGRSAASGQPTKEQADLVVGVLTPEGEAKAQGLEHVLKQVTSGGETEELTGPPTGDAPAGGDVTASETVIRVKLKYPDSGGSADKLIVYATLDTGGKRVVAYALCPLKEATYWEQRLVLILNTLQPGM